MHPALGILLPIIIQIVSSSIVGWKFRSFIPNVLAAWGLTTLSYYFFLAIFNKDPFDLIAVGIVSLISLFMASPLGWWIAKWLRKER